MAHELNIIRSTMREPIQSGIENDLLEKMITTGQYNYKDLSLYHNADLNSLTEIIGKLKKYLNR